MSCGKVLLKIEKEIGFCRQCSKKVQLVGANSCMCCGKPIEDSSDEYCQQCNNSNHYFAQNKAVFIYEGPVKLSMYKFKYSNRRCFSEHYAKYAFKKYGKWIAENNIEAIVPVPMYNKKKKVRGYNQAEVFAKALSQLTGIPVADKIVRREKETVAMKELKSGKRKKNLLKAFKLAENIVQFRKVLIVDDIYTTGTTLDEVARALKLGGVEEVYGLCVCIGEMQ
jgi:ComF family protein